MRGTEVCETGCSATEVHGEARDGDAIATEAAQLRRVQRQLVWGRKSGGGGGFPLTGQDGH